MTKLFFKGQLQLYGLSIIFNLSKKELSSEEKDKINHTAYTDVLNCTKPTSRNDYYMECYEFWSSTKPD